MVRTIFGTTSSLQSIGTKSPGQMKFEGLGFNAIHNWTHQRCEKITLPTADQVLQPRKIRKHRSSAWKWWSTTWICKHETATRACPQITSSHIVVALKLLDCNLQLVYLLRKLLARRFLAKHEAIPGWPHRSCSKFVKNWMLPCIGDLAIKPRNWSEKQSDESQRRSWAGR